MFVDRLEARGINALHGHITEPPDSDTSALRAEIRDAKGKSGAAEALAEAIADFFRIAPPARL